MRGLELVERRVELRGNVTQIGRIRLEIARGDNAMISASVEFEQKERFGLIAERAGGEENVEAPLKIDKVRHIKSELVEHQSNLLGVLGVVSLQHADHIFCKCEYDQRICKVQCR